MDQHDAPKPDSIARAVGKELVRETGRSLRWGGAGAVVGAVGLGGVGFYLLGLKGLAIGACAGAVLGGLAALWFYFEASTVT